MDWNCGPRPSPLWQNVSVPSFLMPPTHPISLRKPCQGKFSLLAFVTAVPFSYLRMMDSGAHQRSKGTEEISIRSFLFSSVLQIQTFVTLSSCCAEWYSKQRPARSVFCGGSLALSWQGFCYIQNLCAEVYWQWGETVWATAGGLCCQTDASHLRQDGLRREEEFCAATGPHSLSVHTQQISSWFDLTKMKNTFHGFINIAIFLSQNFLMRQQ